MKHSSCEVKTVQQAIRGRHLKDEIQVNLEALVQLQKEIETVQTRSQLKLTSYSKEKEELKIKLKTLQEEINNILLTCVKQLDSEEQTNLERLNANIQACIHFQQMIGVFLKSLKETAGEMPEEGLFLSAVKGNRVYNKYKLLLEHLINEANECGSFVLQTERLLTLIQQISYISSSKEGSGSRLSDNDWSNSDRSNRRTKDQCCQVGNSLHNSFEDLKKEPGCCVENQIPDVPGLEQDSSEEIIDEWVSKKSFCDIQSGSVVKELNDIKKKLYLCCPLPDERVLVCTYNTYTYTKDLFDSQRTCTNLEILDNDMDIEAYIDFNEMITYVVVVDKQTVVASIRHFQKVCLQLISVKPKNIGLEKLIDLNYKCDGLASYNNTIYVYSNDLKQSPFSSCKGVQILSMNGDVLKTVHLLDYLCGFCLNKDGNITYIGERRGYSNTSKFIFKCVTKEGSVKFSYPVSMEVAKSNPSVMDGAGNIIKVGSSGKIIVMKLDGSERTLLETENKNETVSAVFYNHFKDILLVVFQLYDKQKTYISCKLKFYQLEYQ